MALCTLASQTISSAPVFEHKKEMVDGHTKRYGIDRVVYFEIHETAYQAIQREKNIKHWPRVYKTRLIAKENVTWRDLYDENCKALGQ